MIWWWFYMLAKGLRQSSPWQSYPRYNEPEKWVSVKPTPHRNSA